MNLQQAMQNYAVIVVAHILSSLSGSEKKRINNVILFGSIARGDYDEESDVDIFINLKKESGKRKMEEVVDNSINKFEAKARETYFLRGIKNPIK